MKPLKYILRYAFLLGAFLFSTVNLLAQQVVSVPTPPETMRAYGKLPVVATVAGIIFTGIVVYLVIIDRKVSKLEKEVNAQ